MSVRVGWVVRRWKARTRVRWAPADWLVVGISVVLFEGERL